MCCVLRLVSCDVCVVCCVLCVVCCVLLRVCCVLCVVSCFLCPQGVVSCVVCVVSCLLCRVCCVLCRVFCVLFGVSWVLCVVCCVLLQVSVEVRQLPSFHRMFFSTAGHTTTRRTLPTHLRAPPRHHPYNLKTTSPTASPHDLFLTTPILFPPFCFSSPHFIVNIYFLYTIHLFYFGLYKFTSNSITYFWLFFGYMTLFALTCCVK